jgi:glutathione peroxidase
MEGESGLARVGTRATGIVYHRPPDVVESRNPAGKGALKNEMTLHEFRARSIDGTDIALSDYRGRVVLVVNVASQCGFTPQYAGLERLHEKFKDRGFAVLGFPCNQFGKQEPGSESEIKSFCESRFGVTFPLFAKIDVNGPQAHPLYNFLVAAKRGFLGSKRIKWNFTKFLVDRDGRPLKRYGPQDKPEAIEADIERAL